MSLAIQSLFSSPQSTGPRIRQRASTAPGGSLKSIRDSHSFDLFGTGAKSKLKKKKPRAVVVPDPSSPGFPDSPLLRTPDTPTLLSKLVRYGHETAAEVRKLGREDGDPNSPTHSHSIFSESEGPGCRTTQPYQRPVPSAVIPFLHRGSNLNPVQTKPATTAIEPVNTASSCPFPSLQTPSSPPALLCSPLTLLPLMSLDSNSPAMVATALSSSSSSSSSSSPSSRQCTARLFYCRALYPFAAASETVSSGNLRCLCLQRNDIIQVLNTNESGWWNGVIVTALSNSGLGKLEEEEEEEQEQEHKSEKQEQEQKQKQDRGQELGEGEGKEEKVPLAPTRTIVGKGKELSLPLSLPLPLPPALWQHHDPGSSTSFGSSTQRTVKRGWFPSNFVDVISNDEAHERLATTTTTATETATSHQRHGHGHRAPTGLTPVKQNPYRWDTRRGDDKDVKAGETTMSATDASESITNRKLERCIQGVDELERILFDGYSYVGMGDGRDTKLSKEDREDDEQESHSSRPPRAGQVPSSPKACSHHITDPFTEYSSLHIDYSLRHRNGSPNTLEGGEEEEEEEEEEEAEEPLSPELEVELDELEYALEGKHSHAPLTASPRSWNGHGPTRAQQHYSQTHSWSGYTDSSSSGSSSSTRDSVSSRRTVMDPFERAALTRLPSAGGGIPPSLGWGRAKIVNMRSVGTGMRASSYHAPSVSLSSSSHSPVVASVAHVPFLQGTPRHKGSISSLASVARPLSISGVGMPLSSLAAAGSSPSRPRTAAGTLKIGRK